MTYPMEDEGVDRTDIDCRQNQLGQMADFLPLLTFLIYKNLVYIPQIFSIVNTVYNYTVLKLNL